MAIESVNLNKILTDMMNSAASINAYSSLPTRVVPQKKIVKKK